MQKLHLKTEILWYLLLCEFLCGWNNYVLLFVLLTSTNLQHFPMIMHHILQNYLLCSFSLYVRAVSENLWFFPEALGRLSLKLVNWYFEPSQPQRITSRLKTVFNMSPIYSACKSSNHKLSINHKIGPDTNLHKTKHTQTLYTKFLKN